MTYNVFGGTLNPAQSNPKHRRHKVDSHFEKLEIGLTQLWKTKPVIQLYILLDK